MGRRKRRKKEDQPRVPSNEWPTVDILDIDDDVKQIITGYFDRKFHYSSGGDGGGCASQTDENLQNLQLNCQQPTWEDDRLQEIKRFLNEAKNNLSTFDIKVWHSHTQEMHKGAKIVPFVKGNVKCEMCTQAWCKFHEILCSFPHLVKLESENFNSFHLCEAPGAFIASLNHYLVSRNYKGRWRWRASTLNPMYEENDLYSMIDVDDFIQGTIENWCFGVDDTGDITSLDNIEYLKTVCIENNMNDIHLVTCDGSIDCANNPGDQESIVYRLHLCEIISGVSLLCDGGCMVLKVFTLFESTSVSFMYLLSILFKQLSIHKPVTSKPGNSELYVICSGFLGISPEFLEKLKCEIKTGRYLENTQLFTLDAISSSFLEEHINCCKKFAEWQYSAITNNLKSFYKKASKKENAEKVDDGDKMIQSIQNGFLAWYCNLCNLHSINSSQFLAKKKYYPHAPKKQLNVESGSKFRHQGTLLERRAKLENGLLYKLSSEKAFDVDQLEICISSQYIPLNIELRNMKPVHGKKLKCIKSSKFANKNVLSSYLNFLESDLIKDFTANRRSVSMLSSAKFDLNVFSQIQKAGCYQYYHSSNEQINYDIENYYNQNNTSKIMLKSEGMQVETNKLIQIECLSDLTNHDMGNIVINEECIHSLFNLLNNLPVGSSLLLLMGCPLTRTLAQLYRVLIASFQKVEVFLVKQLPYIHVMCSYLAPINEDLFYYLMNLKSSSSRDQIAQNNFALLSFLHLFQLYDCQTFETLQKINDTFMKCRVNYFIDVLDKRSQQRNFPSFL